MLAEWRESLKRLARRMCAVEAAEYTDERKVCALGASASQANVQTVGKLEVVRQACATFLAKLEERVAL